MAADDTIAPPDDAYSASDSGGGSSWVSDHKYAVGGGILVLLVVGFVILRKKSSGSSGGSVGTSTGPAVYEVAPGYLQPGYGSSSQYGSSVGFDQGIASQTQAPAGGGTVTGTGAASSGTSTAGSVNNNASQSSGYTRISNPQQGSSLAAAGYDTFTNVGGNYVEVSQGTKWVPNAQQIIAGGDHNLYYNGAMG